MDSAAGNQAVTSANVSADQVVAIQVFGNNIQNANGLAVRFEYDASQTVYEGFDAGDVLPNAQALSEQGPGFVEIGIASLGGQATVNSGLAGTVRFRTTAAFSGTAIRLVRVELSRGGRFETITLKMRVELQLQVLTPDFNGDGVVNFADFLAFVAQFGTHQGDGRYDAKYDLDSDSAIGFGDFLIFSSSFGKEVPTPSGSGSTTTVTIPDTNLRVAIETALEKARGVPISKAEMASLTRFDAPNKNISDLTGLEFATNLTRLSLDENQISGVSALTSLTNLTNLQLAKNQISDVAVLTNLTNLTYLHLSDNAISNVAPLSGLIRLEYLNLYSNLISDISPLSNLTNLTNLYLSRNNVSDLSPLVTNTGLGSGDEIDVRDNPLNATSINTHISVLQGRGVNVLFGASKPAVEEIEQGMISDEWEARTPSTHPTGGHRGTAPTKQTNTDANAGSRL